MSDATQHEDNTSKNESEETLKNEVDVKALNAQKAHWRNKAKELEEEKQRLQDQINAKAEEDLKANEKWQELAEKERKEKEEALQRLEAMKTQVTESTLQNKFISEATAAGCIDTDAAWHLLNRSAIELNEDGSVVGLDEAIANLQESKTYLFKEQPKQLNNTTASPKTDVDTSGVRAWKASEVRELNRTGKITPAILAEIEEATRVGKYIED